MNGNKIKEEEILHEVRLNILEEQRHYLCKHLNPQDHFAYLRSKHLLTREDEELIKSEVTSKRRAERFLDILVQKGPNCYKSLVDALLKNGTQLFLAEKLNKEYERKKINLHNLLTGSEPMDPRGDIGVDPAALPRPTVGSIENQNIYKSHTDSASFTCVCKRAAVLFFFHSQTKCTGVHQ